MLVDGVPVDDLCLSFVLPGACERLAEEHELQSHRTFAFAKPAHIVNGRCSADIVRCCSLFVTLRMRLILTILGCAVLGLSHRTRARADQNRPHKHGLDPTP